MGMAGDYINAHKAISNVVEGMFRKMAEHCEFCKNGSDRFSTSMRGRECIYKDGATNSGVCAREICPVLEKELKEAVGRGHRKRRAIRFFKDESDARSVLFELKNLRIPDVVTASTTPCKSMRACIRDHGQEECVDFGGVCRAGVYIDVPMAYGDIFDRLIKDLEDIGELDKDMEK